MPSHLHAKPSRRAHSNSTPVPNMMFRPSFASSMAKANKYFPRTLTGRLRRDGTPTIFLFHVDDLAPLKDDTKTRRRERTGPRRSFEADAVRHVQQPTRERRRKAGTIQSHRPSTTPRQALRSCHKKIQNLRSSGDIRRNLPFPSCVH